MSPLFLRFVPSVYRSRLELLVNTHGFSNTMWLVCDRLLRMGLGLLIGVWIARYLGPEGYGQLSFAGSYVMIFSAIALFGLESIVVRELVNHPDEQHAILGTTCIIRLFSGFLAYVVAVAALLVLRPDSTVTLLLVAMLGSSLLFQALDSTDLWFQSRVLSRYTVLSKSLAFLVSSVAKVLMVLYGASILAIAAATAVEAVLSGILLVIMYGRYSGTVITAWSWSSQWFKRLLAGSVPMLLSGIVLMVYLRIDQVMLGAMASQAEVGQYAAAVRISEVWYFVPTAIVSSLFPGLVQLRSSNPELFKVRLQRLYNLLAFLGYAVAIPVTFISPWLVKLLFGVAYQPAAALLSVLIWAGLFANLTVVRNAHFIAQEWGRALLWSTSLGAASNVVFNLFLIPKYGAMGAAAATCISYWIAAHGACYATASLRPAAAMIMRALVFPRFW